MGDYIIQSALQASIWWTHRYDGETSVLRRRVCRRAPTPQRLAQEAGVARSQNESLGIRTLSLLALPALLRMSAQVSTRVVRLCGGAHEQDISTVSHRFVASARASQWAAAAAGWNRNWSAALSLKSEVFRRNRLIGRGVASSRDMARLLLASNPESAAMWSGVPSSKDETLLLDASLTGAVDLHRALRWPRRAAAFAVRNWALETSSRLPVEAALAARIATLKSIHTWHRASTGERWYRRYSRAAWPVCTVGAGKRRGGDSFLLTRPSDGLKRGNTSRVRVQLH